MKKREIKTVGIVAKPKVENLEGLIRDITAWFKERDVSVVLSDATADAVGRSGEGTKLSDLPGKVDLVVVLGGDGTILSVGSTSAKAGVPLIGINMGSLGFLAETPFEDMFPALEGVLDGNYNLSERLLLSGELVRDGKVIKKFEALNDIVLDNTLLARMIESEVYLDDELVIRFRADGVIVSSPTGSTAYSLSAGGPILNPEIDVFVITPICPHTLTYRPLVVNGNSDIEIVTCAEESRSNLTIDGQRGVELRTNDKIRITKSDYRLKLIRSSTKSFFQILSDKLHWGGELKNK
jgi:NAD+ kinase